MTISEELKQELAPALDALEHTRLAANAKAKNAYMIMVTLAALAAGVIFYLINGTAQPEHFASIITGAIALASITATHHFMVRKPRKQFSNDYKFQIFTRVVETTLPGMRYFPDQGIPEHQFKNSGLISSRVDRYHTEDLFKGTLGSTDLSFAEVKAERKETSTDSDGKSSTKWVTVFDGVYLEADFHKHFSTRVTVLPDFAERTFGWLGKKLQSIGGKTVHLENPEFEKHFVVKGEDPIETRYILTPSMQERILDLQRKFGDTIMLSFQSSKLIILFNTQKQWFEPCHKTQGADLSQIENFLTDLESFTSVVDDLDLNTRIWTKE